MGSLKGKGRFKLDLLLEKFSDLVWQKLFEEASHLEFINSN